MRIHKLTLKGFTGIRSGMGKDEIVLDFDILASDAQLVALAGPNGTGKSTVMDNMHPYRIMPSRASCFRPAGFSYYEHLCQPEAMKELEWSFDGKRYRTSLVFRMNGSKKSDAYLHVLEEGAWKPVVLADGTVSDGKASTYDQCVESILGSPEMFFTSVFAAQNRRSLSSYTDGDIKTLMADLLGLDKIRETGAKANQVAKLLKSGLEGMRSELAKIEASAASVAQLQARLATSKADVENSAIEVKNARDALTEANTALATARAEQNSVAEILARRSSLESRLADEQQRTNSVIAGIQGEIDRETARFSSAKQSLSKDISSLQARLSSLQAQMIQRNTLIARRDEIVAAKAKIDQLKLQEAPLNEELLSAKKAVEAYQALVSLQAEMTGKLDGITREGKAFAQQASTLTEQASLSESVPCLGSDLQPKCPLMKSALAAKAKLPEVEAKTQAMRGEYAGVHRKLEEIAKQMSETNPAQRLKSAEVAVKALGDELRSLEAVAALFPMLESAESECVKTREEIAVTQAEMESKQAEMLKLHQENQVLLESLSAKKARADEEGNRAIEAVRQEIAALPKADSNNVPAMEALVREREQRLAESETTLVSVQKALSQVEALLSAAESDVLAGQSVKDKASRIEADLADWLLLAKAFGNDGIVALTIDDAGPTLGSLTNDLLTSCYGPRFTVEIRTQVETAKGDLREGFEIVVHDAERDDSKSVSVMSGGERVWINEALTRAIALYLAQNADHRFQTLFSDESDGPLDIQRKRMFMDMKRKVMEIGGYDQEYFVSQTPELWSLADVVIDLSNI